MNIYQKLIPIAPIVSLYWNVAAWEIWGILTTSYNTMYTIQCKWWSRYYERFTNLCSMLQGIRLSQMVIALIRISLYIHDAKSLSCDPYMCFFRSPTPWNISKGEEVKDLRLGTTSMWSSSGFFQKVYK